MVASASSLFYGTLLVLQFYQVIPSGSRIPSPQIFRSSFVFYLVAMNMVAFYLVAILSAYLSEQLRQKDEELKKRLVDYNELERLYNTSSRTSPAD